MQHTLAFTHMHDRRHTHISFAPDISLSRKHSTNHEHELEGYFREVTSYILQIAPFPFPKNVFDSIFLVLDVAWAVWFRVHLSLYLET